jgi:GNAT superfamily N-acetyltransferase
MAVVATDGPTLCGSAILIGADMDTRPELSPWLAGVFVVPEFRRRGIGTSLVEYITDRAGAMGVPTLYLYTPSAERLYSRLGWVPIDRCMYKGVSVVVMSKMLAA